MRPAVISDRADAIAHDMIGDVGRIAAIEHIAWLLVGASSWSCARQAARIVVALMRA